MNIKNRLIDFLDNIQHKPRHVRVRILWLLVIVCMVVVCSAWLVFSVGVLAVAKRSPQAKVKKEVVKVLPKEEIEKEIKEAASLWHSIGDAIDSFFDGDITEEELEAELENLDNGSDAKPLKLPLSY